MFGRCSRAALTGHSTYGATPPRCLALLRSHDRSSLLLLHCRIVYVVRCVSVCMVLLYAHEETIMRRGPPSFEEYSHSCGIRRSPLSLPSFLPSFLHSFLPSFAHCPCIDMCVSVCPFVSAWRSATARSTALVRVHEWCEV